MVFFGRTTAFDESDSDEDDVVSVPTVVKKKLTLGRFSDAFPPSDDGQDHELFLDHMDSTENDEQTDLDPELAGPLKANSLDRSLFETNPNSIGLKIMQKMGFKVGDALGSSSSASNTAGREPIRINPANHKRGVGGMLTTPMFTELAEPDVLTRQAQIVDHYKHSHKRREHQKLMKLCFEMSGEYDLFDSHGKSDLSRVNPLWRALVESESNEMKKSGETMNDEDRNRKDPDLDLDQAIVSLVRYLRESHNYCWHCGHQYESREDLLHNCPPEQQQSHHHLQNTCIDLL